MSGRPFALLAALLVCASVPLPAQAGTATDPEIADTLADQQISGGLPGLGPQGEFREADIISVWVARENQTSVFLTIRTAIAPRTANTTAQFEVSFKVSRGPLSLFTSTANGATYSIIAGSEGRARGVSGANVTVNGTDTTLAIPRVAIGATGGDLLESLVVTATANTTGVGGNVGPVDGPAPVPETNPAATDDENAIDRAPNTGFGRTYTFQRPMTRTGIALGVQGGLGQTTSDRNATAVFGIEVTNTGNDPDRVNLTAPPNLPYARITLSPQSFDLNPGSRALALLSVALDRAPLGVINLPITASTATGASANVTATLTVRDVVSTIRLEAAGGGAKATTNRNATLSFDIRVKNTGTDFDTVSLSAPTIAGSARATISPVNFPLAAGATGNAVLSVTLENAGLGVVRVTINATSARGAAAAATALVTVEAPSILPPGADPERDPLLDVPFLTDTADAMGLVKPFGDWAEVVVLALLILIILLLLFILLALLRRRWVVVDVEQHRLDVAPGDSAEVRLRVRNKDRRFHRVRARLRGDEPGWMANLRLKRRDADETGELATGEEIEIDLEGRTQDGDEVDGVLKVSVPPGAAARTENRVELDVVPIDAEGRELPGKGQVTSVHVRAAPGAAPAAGAIRLSRVQHTPNAPAAGEVVTTTAAVSNEGGGSAALRAVLEVDGTVVQELPIVVGPSEENEVLFRWTAGSGANRVRVQIFPG